uniref:Uncharacterized protein n=1 Tax=Plectus sambesii TaxID=2011161 RepID=A0A914VPN7_9BILA
MNCAYNTEGCNISDFMQTYDPQFGLCYTFNYDE